MDHKIDLGAVPRSISVLFFIFNRPRIRAVPQPALSDILSPRPSEHLHLTLNVPKPHFTPILHPLHTQQSDFKKDKKDKKEKKRALEEVQFEDDIKQEMKKSKKDKKDKKDKKNDQELVQLDSVKKEAKVESGEQASAGSDSKIFPLAGATLNASILEAIQQAKTGKLLKKGANECAKTLNHGTADLIVLAADTDPLGIILHLPLICEDKNVPYIFVPSRAALGRACGVTRPVVACSIMQSKDELAQLDNLVQGIKHRVDDLLTGSNQ